MTVHFEGKSSRSRSAEWGICFPLQLQNSCSCAPVISLTHVVCAKCYKANIWVKRCGPDPANGRFGKNFLFIYPLPLLIDVRRGTKGNNFHFKPSMESDLHCIIQTAVKCIICTNYTVQYGVHFVLMHFISFAGRVRQTEHALIMEFCCCSYAKWFAVLVHFTGDCEETHMHTDSGSMCTHILFVPACVCTCETHTRGKSVCVWSLGQVAFMN